VAAQRDLEVGDKNGYVKISCISIQLLSYVSFGTFPETHVLVVVGVEVVDLCNEGCEPLLNLPCGWVYPLYLSAVFIQAARFI
jgi:hypothetical protein